MKILLTGGGTAGHITPLIAVSRELRRLYQKDDLKIHYIGPNDPMSLFTLGQENIKTHSILAGKLRRYFALANITDILFIIPLSFLQSFFLLIAIRPNLVFSKGGTGALPVTFWAWIFMIPVFLHESDIVPGLSNRIASNWAKRMFISFPKTEYFNLAKTLLTGHPIKKELTEGNKESAKEVFNLTFEKPTLLFLGGSQGSEAINDFILLMLNDILKFYEVIHVAGKKNFKTVQLESKQVVQKDLEKYYHVKEFLNEIELKHAYKVADLIISRAGAGGIFEIAATGKPSILIPLPGSAQGHQSKNAYQYSQTGAALIIEQENLTPNFFLGKINHLFAQPELREQMSQSALAFAKPLAAKAIAREILEYLGTK
ncbi:MAG: UDP-N-acetylglucosamine--N-acetylmuramyl-(pentapeptide) pyrophosphoryl-undecaprenol N-acetylglucosamine transferase [Candidatus Staskawiczbacteria bacterium]|nr:UDP-N-acetylglucosamine--N-acetylmuramyl-(pentapeptide) pyrophosphoryl-undecaprenol N-acetylglucosamine transferase [Candidatus Staskawiczbacteria bacterium]